MVVVAAGAAVLTVRAAAMVAREWQAVRMVAVMMARDHAGRAARLVGLAALGMARQRSNGCHCSHHRHTQPGRPGNPACSTSPPCRSTRRDPPSHRTRPSTLRMRWPEPPVVPVATAGMHRKCEHRRFGRPLLDNCRCCKGRGECLRSQRPHTCPRRPDLMVTICAD